MIPVIQHLFFRIAFLDNHPHTNTMTIHSMGLSNTMTSLEIMNIMLQDTLWCVETQKKSAISGQVSAISG